MRFTLPCFALLLASSAHGADWPAFLGPNGNSTSPEKGILAPWPKDGLKVVWHQKTGEGYCAPTVVKGKLYLFDRHENTARLTCMDAKTGKHLWKFEYETRYEDQYGYNGGPRCCPVVDGDRVYLHGPEGLLHCIGINDQKVLWKIDTKKEYGVIQNFFGVGSTPIVEGDLLIVQIGGSPQGSDKEEFARLKGNGTAVVAFDKKTGKERWRLGDELASYSSPVLATIEGKRWGSVFTRSGLLGFNPADGKQEFFHRWRAKSLESVNASNPVVVGNKVFITECYGPGGLLLEVKPGGCKVIWSDEEKGRDVSLGCHWMTPIHVDGYLYGCSGRHDSNAELRCVELATGKVMWSVGKRRLARMSLLLVDGYFISQGEYGDVRLIKVNPKKYEEVSAMVPFPPGKDGRPDRDADPLLLYPCWAAPVLSDGLLYLRGKEQVVCLELIPQKK
jgi:outer membrane protein assembly factor BamB